MRPRVLLAIWIGKLTAMILRWARRGGSTLPGRVARAISPQVLAVLAARIPLGVVVITGTNGKTTAAAMLAAIVRAAGLKPIHNAAGANLIQGITTTLVDAANWCGRLRGDIGVIEVDEATMPAAGRELAPRAVVVTNFFPDQLDRFEDPAAAMRPVGVGLGHISAGGHPVLNADDSLCAALGSAAPSGLPPVYFGLEAAAADMLASAAGHCSRCGGVFQYNQIYYAHLGKYQCTQCGFSRPRPDITVDAVREMDAAGTTMDVTVPPSTFTVRLQMPGLYNVYNALAAAAAAAALDLPPAAIADGLSSVRTPPGRMEVMTVRGQPVYVALVKNSAGFNEVLRTLLADPAPKTLLLALNDLPADGADISWVWDVDFELFTVRPQQLKPTVCTGLRAAEMAVRLKYAGFDPRNLIVESDLETAVTNGLRQIEAGEHFYILPTYTAMLQIQTRLRSLAAAPAKELSH